jgi:hypothetical protein
MKAGAIRSEIMQTIGGNEDLSTKEQHGTFSPVGGFESAAMMFVCRKI